MKKVVLLTLASAITVGTFARLISAKPDFRFTNKLNQTKSLERTNFELEGNKLVFSNLPKNYSEVYVISSDGKLEMTQTINKVNNKIDVAQIGKGMHTIALNNGGETKLFGCFTGAEVIGAKY